VKVNCGALVENLLLSELFGHERGAFTGATQRRLGRFELADGGTIFLDEIGDISPKTQVALLRVLQDQSFERVGGTTSVAVDVRIICATNRNLQEMVANGQFREDLYYRLKGVQIDLPALRDRTDDIPLLAKHFLDVIGSERGACPQDLGPDARRLLCRYGWPGNVRELENVLRSVSLFAEGALLEAKHFADYPELQRCAQAVAPPVPGDLGQDAYTELRSRKISLRDLKKQLENDCIQRALADTEGNITRAADLLGMKRPRLSQLVKEHGLQARCSSN
jgi:transcriptional regulator with GAF, ATPase, and Fis domain